jgi:hypothetical protein
LNAGYLICQKFAYICGEADLQAAEVKYLEGSEKVSDESKNASLTKRLHVTVGIEHVSQRKGRGSQWLFPDDNPIFEAF